MNENLPRTIIAAGDDMVTRIFHITSEPVVSADGRHAMIEHRDGDAQLSASVLLDSIRETYDPTTHVALADTDLDMGIWEDDTEAQHGEHLENVLAVRLAHERKDAPAWVRPERVIDASGLEWSHDEGALYVSNRTDNDPDTCLRLEQIRSLHGPLTVAVD